MNDNKVTESTGADEVFKILIVNVGDHYFGAIIDSIEDIIQRNPTTPVPLSDENVIGVLNLRGHIVTEIDIAKVLGVDKECEIKYDQGFSIVVDKGDEMFSLLFEGVGDVIDIKSSDIEPLPATINLNWLHMSKGVYRMEEKLIVILDFNQLIDSITPKEAA